MPLANQKHRPLFSGLEIDTRMPSRTEAEIGTGNGTLTGVAWWEAGDKQVLVTAEHVMAGTDEVAGGVVDAWQWRNPIGDERLYQGGNGEEYRVASYTDAVLIDKTGAITADAAMASLSDGVDAASKLPCPSLSSGTLIVSRSMPNRSVTS